MEQTGSKYEWLWPLVAMPTMLLSVVAAFFLSTPFVIPLIVFGVCYFATSKWRSLPLRILCGIAISIASLWILPLPSILIAKYHFAKFDIGNVRAVKKVRPSGHILLLHSTRYARTPDECDFQCFRHLASPSIQSVTITNTRPTRFAELVGGRSSGGQFSKTLKLASGSVCRVHNVNLDRSVRSYPAFVSLLRDHCVVETTAPKNFDLTFRSGEVLFDGVQNGSGMGNGNDIDTSYMHGTYYETRLADGSILSREYDMQVCPFAAPLFLSHGMHGLFFERDCKRSEQSASSPIDGLDLSEENLSS
jgi:hypothetical protein